MTKGNQTEDRTVCVLFQLKKLVEVVHLPSIYEQKSMSVFKQRNRRKKKRNCGAQVQALCEKHKPVLLTVGSDMK